MQNQWQTRLQQYINEGTEEHTLLEYKGADSLGKSDGKKAEISKDVSAMANSAGGILVYGIKEFDDDARKHLPEKLDGIDRTQFSKEWLEQIINSNIQPRITGLSIYPVDLDTGPNHVAYVVEVLQSKTAHQAKDKRYYKRFNFTVEAMEDYEVRDVMNRLVLPDAEPVFDFKRERTEADDSHGYLLKVLVKNIGTKLIANFKLSFTFPNYGQYISHYGLFAQGVTVEGKSIIRDAQGDYLVTYRSNDCLFPGDQVDVGEPFQFRYHIDDQAFQKISSTPGSRDWSVNWTLYADDMPKKSGKVALSQLHNF